MLGIVPSAYGSFERGSTYPQFKSLVKIVEHFQVNLHDLVFTDLEKYPDGPPAEKPDPLMQQIILRLTREIEELAAESMTRSDPKRMDDLMAFREELIQRFPEKARALGIKE